MPPVGFEPTTPTGERPQTYTLDRAATGTGISNHTGCPTRYRTRHFFNNSNNNEDIAKKFEQKYVRCVRNEKECVCSACL